MFNWAHKCALGNVCGLYNTCIYIKYGVFFNSWLGGVIRFSPVAHREILDQTS